MANKYELTQRTKISVSKEATIEENPASTAWLDLDNIIAEFSYNGGKNSRLK
ncbi:hypothetical protein DES39_0129 [Orbus hercynius]|uniref:Uncharacterized protein n=1 Tax=Orbus hercynius TaxID=593135 RepID=A0A495RHB7_9GAMM|nr:hypothetical protein [Orbus hercynius]RKS86923.1 hypothetical protein DES39_0129 [Orbus hercynius]